MEFSLEIFNIVLSATFGVLAAGALTFIGYIVWLLLRRAYYYIMNGLGSVAGSEYFCRFARVSGIRAYPCSQCGEPIPKRQQAVLVEVMLRGRGWRRWKNRITERYHRGCFPLRGLIAKTVGAEAAHEFKRSKEKT